ncbi:MAG TPA: ABC transporter substrate-binding protein [Spirochaetes bacterium]|nr:ABC transporter substrate-binding protein [Spirochaetota bacterium]
MKRKSESKKFYLMLGVVVVIALLVVLSSTILFAGKPKSKEEPAPAEVKEEKAAPAEEKVETVKIGFLVPLTGEAAAWGLPGLYGAQMWVEDVNEAGGIKAGGKTYMVEIVKYDDENISSKALLGAKKLVLEEDVSVVLNMAGATVTAIQDFLTKNEMLSISLAPYDTRPEAPYHLATVEPSMIYHLDTVRYIKETYPDVQKVAIVAQDDILGIIGLAILRAAIEAEGMELVYDKFYGFETTDFAPIMTAILAKKPDLISFDGGYSYYVELLAEQAYLLGYEGYLESAEFILGSLSAKVPMEWLEGRTIASFPDWDDPKLPKYSHDFYAEYNERWPGQWGAVSWEYAANLDVWRKGVEKAGSVDPMDVFKALKSMDTIQTIYGEGRWGGEDMWGIDNWLMTTWHTTNVVNGKHSIVSSQMILLDWAARNPGNMDILIEQFRDAGL